MAYWDTGDRVVDVLLQRLEGFSTWPSSSDANAVQQLLQGLIPTVEMLPRAVSVNYSLPHLYSIRPVSPL